MTSEFFEFDENKMEPWIMDTNAASSTEHHEAGSDVGWTEPLRGPIELTLMDEGDVWPDIMGCGADIKGLYVSERVKRIFDEERIDYGRCLSTKIIGELPPALVNVPPPNYYWMALHVGAQRDMIRSGFTMTKKSPKVGIVYGGDPHRMVFVDGTWDGSPLFSITREPRWKFCTRRIIDLASKHKWTNFKFVPIEHIYDEPPHPGVPY